MINDVLHVVRQINPHEDNLRIKYQALHFQDNGMEGSEIIEEHFQC